MIILTKSSYLVKILIEIFNNIIEVDKIEQFCSIILKTNIYYLFINYYTSQNDANACRRIIIFLLKHQEINETIIIFNFIILRRNSRDILKIEILRFIEQSTFEIKMKEYQNIRNNGICFNVKVCFYCSVFKINKLILN